MELIPRNSETLALKAISLLKERFADELYSVEQSAGQHYVHVKRERIVDILTALRDDPELQFDCLMDLAGVDYYNQGMPERFCVVYNLYSFENNGNFRVKAFLPEDDPEIDTVGGLWKSAPWAEREAFDLYGFKFRGHANLKRILLPADYVGYPLRKDYPLRGMGERDRFPQWVAPDKDERK